MRSMVGGSNDGRPNLKMACVCPPQTSIRFIGTVASRAISAASRFATSPRRNSETYFIGLPSSRSARAWKRSASVINSGGLACLVPASLLLGQHHLVEQCEQALGLGLVDLLQGEADVEQDVVARSDVLDQVDRDALAGAAHVDRRPVAVVDFEDARRDGKTHASLLGRDAWRHYDLNRNGYNSASAGSTVSGGAVGTAAPAGS